MQPSTHFKNSIPCIVFRVPMGSDSSKEEVMLALPHHPGRLPIVWAQRSSSDDALQWTCANGEIEQLAINSSHPDWRAIIGEIQGEGLLVCEFAGNETNTNPLSSWILGKSGSGLPVVDITNFD